jgi:hypothetical protein
METLSKDRTMRICCKFSEFVRIYIGSIGKNTMGMFKYIPGLNYVKIYMEDHQYSSMISIQMIRSYKCSCYLRKTENIGNLENKKSISACLNTSK